MSKYPVTNFISDFAQEDSWKYGYFKIDKDSIIEKIRNVNFV